MRLLLMHTIEREGAVMTGLYGPGLPLNIAAVSRTFIAAAEQRCAAEQMQQRYATHTSSRLVAVVGATACHCG